LKLVYDLSNLPSTHMRASHLAFELLAREFDVGIIDFKPQNSNV
jgi:hypothetical protein